MENISVQLAADGIASIPTLSDRLALVEPFAAQRLGQRPVLRGAKPLRDNIVRAYECFHRRGTTNEIRAWEHILDALCYLSSLSREERQGLEEMPLQQHRAFLTRALSFLHRNYHRELSVEDMARHCALSTSRFAHLFSEAMHTPPLQYLTRLRVWSAARRVSTSDDTFSAIAYDCGFTSTAGFYRAFGKVTGTTPSAMRKGCDGRSHGRQ
jgi:AraC-like DNA-binding protein